MGKKLDEIINSNMEKSTHTERARAKKQIRAYIEVYARMCLEDAAKVATVRIVTEKDADHPVESFEQGYWDAEKILLVEPNRNGIRNQRLPNLP